MEEMLKENKKDESSRGDSSAACDEETESKTVGGEDPGYLTYSPARKRLCE